MNTAEAVRQHELVRGLALELLRTWGFQGAELDQLFAHKHSRSQVVEDLEDAVLNAYARLWEELQHGRIEVPCVETIRGTLLDALRRRGLDRRPFTAQRLLVGIATSRRSKTRRRYLQWAKFELKDELKRRLCADLASWDGASLEGVLDYFLAEFVPRVYARLSTHENGGKPLLERCYEAFVSSQTELRRAMEYRSWITPVSPRLSFRSEEHIDLERRTRSSAAISIPPSADVWSFASSSQNCCGNQSASRPI